MSNPDDRLVTWITARITLEHQTRVQLLRVHGWTGVVVGALVLLAGGNRTIEQIVGLWTRTGLGVSAILAGGLLVFATRDYTESVRRLKFQRLSTRTLALWDASMSLGILASIVLYEGPWEYVLPWEPLPVTQPVLFPLAIYVGRGAFALLLHSRAITRVLREKT